MQQYQLDYYKGLSPTQQLILKAMALKMSFDYMSELTELLIYKQKLTQAVVKTCLEEALRYKLVETNSSFAYNKKNIE